MNYTAHVDQIFKILVRCKQEQVEAFNFYQHTTQLSTVVAQLEHLCT